MKQKKNNGKVKKPVNSGNLKKSRKSSSKAYKFTAQEQQKIKDIKRINERRAEIQRAVQRGQLPKTYLDRFDAAIRAAVPDPNMLTKTGNISHGKDTVQSIKQEDIDALLSRETASQAKKSVKKAFEQEREYQRKLREQIDNEEVEINPFTGDQTDIDYDEEPEPMEDITEPEDYTIDDYIRDFDEVNEALDDDSEAYYITLKMAFQGTKGKKTYRDINRALQGKPVLVTQNNSDWYFT